MASTLVIIKQSGVLSLSVDGLDARYFFGASGEYQFSTDTTYVTVSIGNAGSRRSIFEVQVPWTGLTVGSQVASSYLTAKTLLNAIFGT